MSKQNFATNNNNNSYLNQHHHLQQQQQQQQQQQTQYYGSNNTSYNNSLFQPQQSPKSNFNLNSNNQRLTNTNGTNNNSSFPLGQQQQQHQRNNSISTLMNVNSNSTNNMNNTNSSRSNYNNTNNNNSFHSNHHQLHHHNSMQNIYLNNHFNGNNTHNNSNYNNGYQTNSMTFNQVPSQQQQQQQHHIYQKQISLPANVNIARQNHHYHHQQQQSSPPQVVNQQQQQQSLNYSSTSSSSSSSLATHSPTSPTSSPSSSITFTKSNRTPPRLIEVKHHQIAPQSLINEEKQVALPLMSPKIELEIIDETKALLLNSNNEEDYDDGDKEIVLDEEEEEVVFEDDDEVNEKSPARLADLIPSEREFGENKLEYFRHVIVAVDRLYPDTKWPLHNTWTFWHIKNDPNQSWEANIKEIVDVSYVEDFWSVVNYLYTPTNMLAHGGDITFFKKNIRPMWEDVQNKAGGSWLHTIHQYKKNPEIYDYWLETLMALIGDNFCGTGVGRSEQPTVANEHLCDFISGVYASPRPKQHKLALWTQNYKDEKTTRLIG